MKPNALLVGLLLASACSTPGSNPVIGPPSEAFIRYQVSGGIAGLTFADLVIRGDGTVEESVSGSVGQVDNERLQQLARDLGQIDVCGLDAEPIDDGPSGLADGTATVIEISCESGSITHSAYGLGEMQGSFDPKLVRAAEIIHDFAVEANVLD